MEKLFTDCNALYMQEARALMIALPVQRLIAVLCSLKTRQSPVHRRLPPYTAWAFRGMAGWMHTRMAGWLDDTSNYILLGSDCVPSSCFKHNGLFYLCNRLGTLFTFYC